MLIEKKQSRCERMVFWGICALLVFAPLAFGSVHVWAYTVVEIVIFSLLFLLILDRVAFSKPDEVEWIKTPINYILLILVGLIVFQMIPTSESLFGYFSSQTLADKKLVNQILTGAGRKVSEYQYIAYYRHPVIKEGLKFNTRE